MPPIGGGLMQLVAYGAQDVYFGGSYISKPSYLKHVGIYNTDDCIKEITIIKPSRKYKNIEIKQISVLYNEGNASFTINKYKEICDKYDNKYFLTDVDLTDISSYKIEKGNKDVRQIIDKQNNMAKGLRKENRNIDKKNEKIKQKYEKEMQSRESENKTRYKKDTSHKTKRFFYGKNKVK